MIGGVVGLEFYPPRNGQVVSSIVEECLAGTFPVNGLISVTCGAGGSGVEKTWGVIRELRESGLVGGRIMPHLIGSGMSRQEVLRTLDFYHEYGIENILVLRGDPPSEADGRKVEFSYASELLRFICSSRHKDKFSLKVAGHPETHPDALNADSDIRYLGWKVDCGANGIITQSAFDFSVYRCFFDACREADIRATITAGVFLFTSKRQLKRLVQLNRGSISIPKHLSDMLDQPGDREVYEHCIDYTACLCRSLMGAGIPIHLFTMNNAVATRDVLSKLI